MISYYSRKMKDAYAQYQVAVDTDKPIAAEAHMQDYLNYKELHDRMVKSGEDVTDGEED